MLKDKGLAALIIGKSKPAGEESEGPAEEGTDEGLESAAEDVLAAVKSGSAAELVAALRSFIEMC